MYSIEYINHGIRYQFKNNCQNTSTYSLTKRRNLFTFKTLQLIHSQNTATYSLTETNHD